jgi:hypothetical protein
MKHILPNEPREGELHAVVETFGRTFELRYGYYEACDRDGPPDVLYPNFKEEPQYTDEGCPFVTRMQDACPHYSSKKRRCTDSTCGECSYFHRGEDWFGICTCPHNRRNE